MDVQKVQTLLDNLKKLTNDIALLQNINEVDVLNAQVTFNGNITVLIDNKELALRAYRQLRYELKVILETLRTELSKEQIIDVGD